MRALVQRSAGHAGDARRTAADLECARSRLDAPEMSRVRPVLAEALALR